MGFDVLMKDIETQIESLLQAKATGDLECVTKIDLVINETLRKLSNVAMADHESALHRRALLRLQDIYESLMQDVIIVKNASATELKAIQIGQKGIASYQRSTKY